MILELGLALALHSSPATVLVSTPRGEARLPVLIDPVAGPVLAAPGLLAALNGTLTRDDAWAQVTLARQQFRFLLGAPTVLFSERLEPLVSPAFVVRDTLFLPFQFLAELLPRVLGERYQYDPGESRLIEAGPKVIATAPPPRPIVPAASAAPARLPNGLRPGHVVTVDPGHGGVDPGNPGLYFPRGVTESNITLQVGLLLRDELKRRGIAVRMTRTTDTLIDLKDRGAFCKETCDLFVSLHINSLRKRPGFTATRGFETYFLAEARTEDAARVEEMENDAIRYEVDHETDSVGGMRFILQDLQLNEYLRESARAAELIQEHLIRVHPGGDRGVKQANFVVLTTARRPAILAELGYSTNPEDGRLLSNPRTQHDLVTGLADAIVSYLLEYERKTDLITAPTPDTGAKP